MKKYKILILVIFVGIFISLLAINYAKAAPCTSPFDLCYRPNVPIHIKSADNTIDFSKDNKITGGDFLAKYIVAIYTYGAGFAGIVAMFMLVIAGWVWLMAGGNAQKIAQAKEIVSGVLLGLALLFGGQLLLRQISNNFDSIQSLKIKMPIEAIESIESVKDEFCSSIINNAIPMGVKDKLTCDDYEDVNVCIKNICAANGTPPSEMAARDRCIPRYDKKYKFSNCISCSLFIRFNQGCAGYGNVLLEASDPCDIDGDGKYPDDECLITE